MTCAQATESVSAAIAARASEEAAGARDELRGAAAAIVGGGGNAPSSGAAAHAAGGDGSGPSGRGAAPQSAFAQAAAQEGKAAAQSTDRAGHMVEKVRARLCWLHATLMVCFCGMQAHRTRHWGPPALVASIGEGGLVAVPAALQGS